MPALSVNLASLRAEIESGDDVEQVLEIEARGDETWYLIETIYETFPRFIIGRIRPGDFIELRFACGRRESAQEAWAELATVALAKGRNP